MISDLNVNGYVYTHTYIHTYIHTGHTQAEISPTDPLWRCPGTSSHSGRPPPAFPGKASLAAGPPWEASSSPARARPPAPMKIRLR